MRLRHLDLERIDDREYTPFRKIALGTWRMAYDCSVYGTMQLDMEKTLDFMDRFREQTGLRVTVTHVMAKACALALKAMPDANAILRFSRVYRRKNIGIFFQVAMQEGDDPHKIDLSGAVIHDVEKKRLADIIREFEEKVHAVRQKQDPALEQTRQTMMRLPFAALFPIIQAISFIQYTLNIRLPGLPEDPFGSLMVTNVGSLGLDTAYVPIVPYSRVPILVAPGAIKEVPAVVDGKIVPRRVMACSATFDHRFVDGKHAAVMSKVIHECFDDPDRYFGPIEA